MGSAPATEKSRSSRLSLGVRLTLLTLTLVLIPLFLIAGGAYLRAADLLKNQTNPEITAALSDLAPITIGLVVAATLLILILVPLISRRFLRPLDALITFSERLAAGDLKYRVSTNKNDEIGRLAQSLNHMADELNEFYMTLEARVLQRTKEIRLAAEMAREAVMSINYLKRPCI